MALRQDLSDLVASAIKQGADSARIELDDERARQEREHQQTRDGAEKRANEICDYVLPDTVRHETHAHTKTPGKYRRFVEFDCAALVMTLNRWEYEDKLDGSYWTEDGPKPDYEKLRYAARLVFDRCKAAGLSPILTLGREGGPTTIQITIRWNLPK
jgi:hypothetical protein